MRVKLRVRVRVRVRVRLRVRVRVRVRVGVRVRVRVRVSAGSTRPRARGVRKARPVRRAAVHAWRARENVHPHQGGSTTRSSHGGYGKSNQSWWVQRGWS